MNQSGFDFASGIGFDTGRGQATMDFSQPESAHSKDERERRRRNSEESAKRAKREREEKQKADREREERARRDREQSSGRTRHTYTFETAHELLGVRVGASAKEIRAAWAAKLKACHPDLQGGNADDAKRFNAAYNQLKKGGR